MPRKKYVLPFIELDGFYFSLKKRGYYSGKVLGVNTELHRYIYAKYHGKISPSMHVHHIDGNKANNDIDNLQLLTREHHTRLHTGFQIIDGQWFKPCTRCNILKSFPNNYHKQGRQYGAICKECMVVVRKERELLDPDGCKKYRSEYHLKNREQRLINQKIYEREHAEEINARKRIYRAKKKLDTQCEK